MIVFRQMKRWPRWGVFLLAAFILALVGYTDYITGPEVHFAIFYFLPVFVYSWFFGRRVGYAASLACSAVWLLTGVLNKEIRFDAWFLYWNLGVRQTSFMVVAWLVDGQRRLGRKIDDLVDEQTAKLRTEVDERKRAEDATHQLADQLSQVEHHERRRMAHDIHDTLGQTLTVLKMNLQATLERTTDLEQIRRLSESLALIENMIKQTRTLIFELYPAMLEHLGLVPTIRKHAESFKAQTGIPITVSEMGTPLPLANHALNYLFRATKELINNAAKHGQALEIMVAVHWRPGGGGTNGEPSGVRIVVDDDGSGFEVEKALAPNLTRGLGLASIAERLMSLGGKMDIESAPGKGTRCILELATENTPLAAALEA